MRPYSLSSMRIARRQLLQDRLVSFHWTPKRPIRCKSSEIRKANGNLIVGILIDSGATGDEVGENTALGKWCLRPV